MVRLIYNTSLFLIFASVALLCGFLIYSFVLRAFRYFWDKMRDENTGFKSWAKDKINSKAKRSAKKKK